MKLWVIAAGIIAVYCVAQLLFTGYFILRSKSISGQSFAGKTELGKKSAPELDVFLAGDSVAAGVGASSFGVSLAGRLANGLAGNHHVIFTNVAKSGSKMADLTSVPEQKQDIVVLFIASNDLYHFTNLKKFKSDTESALERYSKTAKRVILVGPADIGGATAIPLIMKPIYWARWPKYAAIMRTAAGKYPNMIYIYPAEYSEKLMTYGHTEAVDGFHPNDNGHRFWADLILSQIQR